MDWRIARKQDNYLNSPLMVVFFSGESEVNQSSAQESSAGDLEIERYLESQRGIIDVIYV